MRVEIKHCPLCSLPLRVAIGSPNSEYFCIVRPDKNIEKSHYRVSFREYNSEFDQHVITSNYHLVYSSHDKAGYYVYLISEPGKDYAKKDFLMILPLTNISEPDKIDKRIQNLLPFI